MTANNMASMHEALMKIREYIITGNTGYEPKELLELILNWCDSSLTEPPRNCDVGTVEEQRRRKHEYCKETQCSGCPANKGGTISTDRCDFTWAQMPFDSRGKCGDAQ